MTDDAVLAMTDAAAQATGLDYFGDEWFAGPLRAWAEDLEQPNLNEFGRGFLRSLAVRDLARRLRVLDTLRQHPEIADVPIPPIMYITGLERSGTTLLHNLLALHPRGRALLRWELMEPVPPPTAETFATDQRIRAVQVSIDKLRGSALEGMHWVNADEPEECVWGFIDSVGMLGQAAVMCMPQWSRFIAEEDLTPALENYRRVVQILLWKHPVGPGGFLVLKAPQIAAHVATFAKVFPEARFVITDRDPYRCVVSLAVLGHTIVDPFCIDNPLIDDGQRQRQVLTFARSKLAALSSFTEAEPNRVLHVGYPRLMSDPAPTVETVLSAVGISFTEDMTDRVEAFLAAQRSGARVAPPRELATMGYDHGEVLADPVIADYCQRFGIEPERSRLTGAQPPA
ncbi:MAG: sulfotransferase [Actinomycetota bacterium]|nr:sulfotransferase [Actinomycetota bacterium]